jgi:hypothetical protein
MQHGQLDSIPSGELDCAWIGAYQIFLNVSNGGVESAERVPIKPATVTPATPPATPVSHIHGLKV